MDNDLFRYNMMQNYWGVDPNMIQHEIGRLPQGVDPIRPPFGTPPPRPPQGPPQGQPPRPPQGQPPRPPQGQPPRPPQGQPPRPPQGQPPRPPQGQPPRPPQGQPPRPPQGPPPSRTPSKPIQTFRVDAGSIRNCMFRFTYIWQSNGTSYWMIPIQVSHNTVSGFRWNRRWGWQYSGTSLRSIDAFTCV